MKAQINGITLELSVSEFVELQTALKTAADSKTAAEPGFGFDEPLNVKIKGEDKAAPKKKVGGIGLRHAIRIRFADHSVETFRGVSQMINAHPVLATMTLSKAHKNAEEYVQKQANVVKGALAPVCKVAEYTRWTKGGNEITVRFPTYANGGVEE